MDRLSVHTTRRPSVTASSDERIVSLKTRGTGSASRRRTSGGYHVRASSIAPSSAMELSEHQSTTWSPSPGPLPNREPAGKCCSAVMAGLRRIPHWRGVTHTLRPEAADPAFRLESRGDAPSPRRAKRYDYDSYFERLVRPLGRPGTCSLDIASGRSMSVFVPFARREAEDDHRRPPVARVRRRCRSAISRFSSRHERDAPYAYTAGQR